MKCDTYCASDTDVMEWRQHCTHYYHDECYIFGRSYAKSIHPIIGKHKAILDCHLPKYKLFALALSDGSLREYAAHQKNWSISLLRGHVCGVRACGIEHRLACMTSSAQYTNAINYKKFPFNLARFIAGMTRHFAECPSDTINASRWCCLARLRRAEEMDFSDGTKFGLCACVCAHAKP